MTSWLRLHILGAGNQKRHYTYVPWMLWLMLGIPKFCMSFHHKCHNPDFSVATLWFPWSLRRETWQMALWSVSWIHAPKTRSWVFTAWLRVHGSMVVYPFKKSPLIPKVRQKSDLMSDFFWKKSQDFNISTAVGHTETWLQLTVFGFGRHGRQSQRRSWSWRKSFGSDSMDQMCLDKAEDGTDGPMEV